jgi:beta-fructofuranosidase
MNRSPLKILHPSRFIWDVWQTWDAHRSLFHVFFLNAPKPSIREERYHHLARIGYAQTQDFVQIDWINDDMFVSDPNGWDNASIWSGDVLAVDGGWLLGYTSRDLHAQDRLAQTIGFAFSPDLKRWERLPELTLSPDDRWYESSGVHGDNSIHGWRDPHFITLGDRLEIIWYAKSKGLPPQRKACIARATLRRDHGGWEVHPPLVKTGWYSEMDVPQLLQRKDGDLDLLFTVGSNYDFSPSHPGAGGAQIIQITRSSWDRNDTLKHPKPELIVPANTGMYAFRAVPELPGLLLGFDVHTGGWIRFNECLNVYEPRKPASRVF